MVAEVKALLKAMKQEYRLCGYTVAVEERRGNAWVKISGENWMVKFQQNRVPKKVLGLLVEHLGLIPGMDELWGVAKGGAQKLYEDFRNLSEGWTGEPVPVTRTPLALLGYPLWWSGDLFVPGEDVSSGLFAVEPEQEALMDRESGYTVSYGGGLLWMRDDESEVWVKTYDGGSEVWDYMMDGLHQLLHEVNTPEDGLKDMED